MKKKYFLLTLFLGVLLLVVSTQFINRLEASATTGYIWVDSERNQIQGRGWMTGANISITKEEDVFVIAAGEGGDFILNFGGTGYNIEIGDRITATHAGNTIEHTVQSPFTFDFTQEQFESEVWQGERAATISGTAPANSYIVLWLTQMGQRGRDFDEVHEIQANAQGVWTHTFDTTELKPFEWKDIDAFLLQDYDGETVRLSTLWNGSDPLTDIVWSANATHLKRVSDPGGFILSVYPQINSIWGHTWPYGNLNLTVQRGSQTFTYNYGVHTGGDFQIHYDDHRINIQTGDIVTVAIGELSLSHEVRDIVITDIDTVGNKISGTAHPNRDISVEIGTTFGSYDNNRRSTQADSQGRWTADFSVPQEVPWSDEPFPIENITTETKFWVIQGGDPVELDYELMAWTSTLIANQRHLIDLVRSFIVTRMAEFAAISTNISAVLDDPSQKLVFESANLGKIEFSSFDIETLLVINPAYLEKLEDFIKISYNSDENTLSTKVQTSTLEFLSGHSATIQFFDVAKKLGIQGITTSNVRDYISISVIDGDEIVTDTSDYFDWENVVYDPQADILTLPVNHFTEYVLGDANDLAKTGTGVIYLVSFGLMSLVGFVVLKRYNVIG